jgi:hypothetical protein
MKTIHKQILKSPQTKKDSDYFESFSEALDKVSQSVTSKKVSLGQIENCLKGRGLAALGLILCIPFIQPIPVPGLSILFGLAFVIIGGHFTFGKAGALPAFIKKTEIDAATLKKMVRGTQKVLSFLESLLKPRIRIMSRRPMLNILGICIMTSGLALSLPLPPVILFSNSLPAFAIICLCLGYLERDGLLMIAGHLIAILTWCYLAFWWEMVSLGIEKMTSRFLI